MSVSAKAMIAYLPVPANCQAFISTVHFGNMPAGYSRGPILVPQIWVCTSPVWWLGTETGLPVRLPPVALIGPTSQAVAVVMGGALRFPGCGLTARGWNQLVGIPAHEAVDCQIDCMTLWKDPCDRLLQELAAARTEKEEHRAMLAFACRLSNLSKTAIDIAQIRLINQWLSGPNSLDALAAKMGLSSRQVGRITLRTHGLSPKHLFAKHRAIRAANLATAVPTGSPEVWLDIRAQYPRLARTRVFNSCYL